MDFQQQQPLVESFAYASLESKEQNPTMIFTYPSIEDGGVQADADYLYL